MEKHYGEAYTAAGVLSKSKGRFYVQFDGKKLSFLVKPLNCESVFLDFPFDENLERVREKGLYKKLDKNWSVRIEQGKSERVYLMNNQYEMMVYKDNIEKAILKAKERFSSMS